MELDINAQLYKKTIDELLKEFDGKVKYEAIEKSCIEDWKTRTD